MTTESRTREAIAADLRECAEIWRRRAEECFGNPLMFHSFRHAVLCAERFEAQLREILAEERKIRASSQSL